MSKGGVGWQPSLPCRLGDQFGGGPRQPAQQPEPELEDLDLRARTGPAGTKREAIFVEPAFRSGMRLGRAASFESQSAVTDVLAVVLVPAAEEGYSSGLPGVQSFEIRTVFTASFSYFLLLLRSREPLGAYALSRGGHPL